MSKIDYLVHEEKYRIARMRGDPAWGGSMAAHRLSKMAELVERLSSDSDFPGRGELLELGCGAGNLALMFAKKGYAVSGVDISGTAVQWAKEEAEKHGIPARFLAGNVLSMPWFHDAQFDGVLDGNLLHCIIGEDRRLVLREACRVLKPGGVFFVSTNCGDPKDERTLKSFDPLTRVFFENGIAYRYYGEPESILGELAQAGFKTIWSEVNRNPWGNHLRALLKKRA